MQALDGSLFVSTPGSFLASAKAVVAYLVPMLLLLIPFALYFTSMRQSARLASGLKPVPSFVVAVLPFVLMVLVGALAHSVLAPLIPPAMPAPG